MDPVMALLLALYIAGKFGSNVAQDVAWKSRGEDPPSYRREQERWQRKQDKRATGDGPGRKLLTNAWRDACASADDHRARIAERAAERRRSKWEEADLDKAEDDAREVNERVTPVETVWPCGGGCGQTLTNADIAGYALSGDPLCRACRTAPADATGKSPGRAERDSSAPDGNRPPEGLSTTCGACTKTYPDHGGFAWIVTGGVRRWACPGCQPKQQPVTEPATTDKKQTPDTAPAPTATGGTVTDLNQWRTKGTTPPITKEDLVSGETTNLSAALTYTQDMGSQCAAGAGSAEQSIATMRAADVGEDVIGHLIQAQEALSQAMTAFIAAHGTLERHIQVKEAYAANQSAGDKAFVTQE